jgi:MATE family multidrug resistance protein
MLHRSAVIAEIRATAALAAPLAGASLSQLLLGFTDTVMVGYLGSDALAAAGLGAGLYFTIGLVFQGVVTAVSPLVAQALGARAEGQVAQIVADGVVLALLLAVPFAGIGFLGAPLLHGLGYEPLLADEVGRFLHAIVWGAPGFLLFATLRSFLAAVSRPRSVMLVLLACLAANAGLNYVLIFGKWGLPQLGIVGSGCASAIVNWLMALGLIGAVAFDPILRRFGVHRQLRRPSRHGLAELLRVGAPIAGIYALEAGVFITAGLLMGLFGPAALAAHNVALNFAALTFMVPLGISHAATVRVALAAGAGDDAGARRAGLIAFVLGVGFMAGAAIVLWLFPRPIIGIYLDVENPGNAETVAIALRLLAVAAAFQIFDGAQAVAAGALRGFKDTRVPMLLGAIGYWGIGFCGGWALAFPLGWGPLGLWIGLAVGLGVVAALLALRFCTRGRSVVPILVVAR